MMTRQRGIQLGLAIGLGMLIAASTAQASDPCVGDAKLTAVDCKADCKEAYQVGKDACRNKDHDCMEGCRAGRAECILTTSLDEDLTACRNTLRQAKDDCRTDPANVGDEAAIDTCIDGKQVDAFLCRRTARTTSKPAITACRLGFRACAEGCPQNPDPMLNVDKVQCKIDAKDAYLVCKGDCREAFQAQKDLCLGHEHVCVEGCRATRDGCRQPIEDQLDADIAACNATKTIKVQECKNTFPEGTERDDCITDKLVVAFQCRDQAREDAKPGFEGCRAAFQVCVEGVNGVGGCPAS